MEWREASLEWREASLVGVARSLLGVARSLLGEARKLLGVARSLLGVARSLLGVTVNGEAVLAPCVTMELPLTMLLWLPCQGPFKLCKWVQSHEPVQVRKGN